MEQDKRLVLVKPLDVIAGREGKPKWALNRNTETLDEREITLDCVRVAIDGGDMLIEEACSLARIAHAVKVSRTTGLADERAAEQALEIERQVRAQPPRFAEPRQQLLRPAKT